MLPSEMVADTRLQINSSATFGRVSDSELIALLNRGKDRMAQKVIESDVNFWEVDELLSFVGLQDEYNLPANFFKVTLVERLNVDGTVLRRLDYVNFQEKERFTLTHSNVTDSGQVYYLRGRKIGFKPIPAQSVASAVRLYGIQFPHDMVWCRAQSAGTNVFTIPPASDATNMKAGRPSTESDYYKNARFRFITGAAIGVELRCTAYNPITRVVTLESNHGASTNDEVVLICEIPEPYHHGLIQYAVARAAAKDRDRTLYNTAMGEFNDQVAAMITSIDPRHYDGSLHVMPPHDLWGEL